ncbi:TIM barrel protein [Candidatus Poribacteria bacterium]|nr:TIM barrel protein [Candidatus Poribacteria bacterium]
MKFGFRTGGFSGWKIEDVLKELSEIGFDGLEICLESPDVRPENFTPGQADDIKKLLAQINLEIASVSYHADNESSQVRKANTTKCVEIANWLDTDILIVNAERIKEGEKESQWQELVDWLKELTGVGEKYKVNIAFEPEPLLIIHDTDDMLEMIKEVDSPNLKVNLDIGHAYITDPDLPDSIRKLGDNIVHAHIEDIKDRVHSHLELGQGDIDFKAMHQAFTDIGYKGYYVVDLFRLGDKPSEVAKRSLKALKSRF